MNLENLGYKDYQKAIDALRKADVKEPYVAVVDPKWSEEDIVRILSRNFFE